MSKVVGGYKFKNDELLSLALTHSSFSEKNYERLEFLGDSILDFLVAEYFYNKTTKKEGELTKLRAYFVSANHLSCIFDNLNIVSDINLGKSCKNITKSIKCDMLEAIIGAIYIDDGINACKIFIEKNLKLCDNINHITDSKSMLQEWAQKNRLKVEYSNIENKGTPHNPIFIVKASVGKYVNTASGTSKQSAQEKCAKNILDDIIKGDK